MGADYSIEDSKEDLEDERQPDQTTFVVEYETFDPLYRAGDRPENKTYTNRYIKLFELLNFIQKRYIFRVRIVKIKSLPDLEIKFTCLRQHLKIGKIKCKYIKFRDIVVTPATYLNSPVEDKDIRYYLKDQKFTVDGQQCENGIVPEPF